MSDTASTAVLTAYQTKIWNALLVSPIPHLRADLTSLDQVGYREISSAVLQIWSSAKRQMHKFPLHDRMDTSEIVKMVKDMDLVVSRQPIPKDTRMEPIAYKYAMRLDLSFSSYFDKEKDMVSSSYIKTIVAREWLVSFLQLFNQK